MKRPCYTSLGWLHAAIFSRPRLKTILMRETWQYLAHDILFSSTDINSLVVGSDWACVFTVQSAHSKLHIGPKFTSFMSYGIAWCEISRLSKLCKMECQPSDQGDSPRCVCESSKKALSSRLVCSISPTSKPWKKDWHKQTASTYSSKYWIWRILW